MIKKKIINIVFYKTSNSSETEKLACIFYADGTVSNVSFEEGIDACEEIVKEHGIKSKDTFQEMINKELVHVMSAKEFSQNFKSFVPTTIVNNEEDRREEIESVAPEQIAAEKVTEKDEEDAEKELDEVFSQAAHAVAAQVGLDEVKKGNEENHQEEEKIITGTAEEDPFEHEEEVKVTDSKKDTDEEEDKEKEEEDPFAASEADFVDPEDDLEDDRKDKASDSQIPIDAEIEDPEVIEEAKKSDEQPKGIKGFFKRIAEKLKKNKLIKRIAVCFTALSLATGLFACGQRQTLEGEMLNSNLITTTTDKDATGTRLNVDGFVLSGNNDYYDDYTYEELVEVTFNETQKNAMINAHDALLNFNDEFAGHYLENGKNVRAALKFDEIIALQMAYNDYSKKDILAIFNGAEIRSDEMVRAYKDASLQLMGAYAMENSNHPVDMSMLLTDEEGVEFYNRYHEAFLEAKDATGQDKLDKVKAFYAMVRNDFPITEEVRTEGISHAENYESLEPYKLSVTPMIAAAEMLFQNLKYDYTLGDGEIDFINDLGLCNYAEETFERIETITLTSVEDETNPTYEQYRNAIIEKMKATGYYYINDEARELTKLDSFQDAVNGEKKDYTKTGTNTGTGKTTTTTTTRQEVETHTDTTTTYHTEETRVEKTIPDDVKAQIDAQIAAENEAARRQAEIEAERERQRLQAIEDENARRIQEEIRREEEDLQNRLNNINNIINNNNSDQNTNNDRVINESDFGDHGVHFDPQHQDGNGNLNNSVQNITTDPTGDKTNDPLPDPNQTGAVFDSQAPSYQSSSYQLPTTGEAPTTTTTTQGDVPAGASTAVDNNGNEYNFWIEESTSQTGTDGWTEVSGIQIDPEYQGYVQPLEQSNEQIVNDYVEGLANSNNQEYGEGYQYTK